MTSPRNIFLLSIKISNPEKSRLAGVGSRDFASESLGVVKCHSYTLVSGVMFSGLEETTSYTDYF